MGLARVSTAILALRNNPETATVKSVATLSTARVSPPGGASPGRASVELHQAMAGRLPGRGAARVDRARPETVGCPQHGARRGAAVGVDRITGHRTESIYRRYAIVSDADLQATAARRAQFGSGDRGGDPLSA